MAVLKNAFVYMVGDSWDKWVMEFWLAEPDSRWVTFGTQSIEQTEEFAIGYVQLTSLTSTKVGSHTACPNSGFRS
jgi:hypothetical protein